MKFSNPLSNMQSIQQAPIGLPPAIAQYYQQQQQQQQAPQSFDQSQLAQYIQQLQNNGASPEQIQGVVQQIQQNGGNAPQTEDTMQGGAGQDTISGGGASQSPLSQALNQMASGQGNINYDQVNQAYPSMRPPVQNTEGELYQQELGKLATAPGGGIATMLQAQSAAKADQTAQSNALAALQNQRDVNAFGATTGIAEKAGNIATQKNKIDQMADYRQNQLEVAQAKLDASIKNNADKTDIAQQRADIAQQRADLLSSTNRTKPLSADLQKQLGLGLDQFIGVRDAKGNTLDTSKDIDPTQKNSILANAAMYLQQNPNVGVQGALGHVINEKLGGINTIQEAKTKFFGKNTPRMFPPTAIQGLNDGVGSSQTAPNVTPNVINPASTESQGGGAKVDAIVQQFMQKYPDATPDEVATLRKKAITQMNNQ